MTELGATRFVLFGESPPPGVGGGDDFVVGVCPPGQQPPSEAAAAPFDLVLVDAVDAVPATSTGMPRCCVAVESIDAAMARLTSAVSTRPRSLAVLLDLLRRSPQLAAEDALVAESLAYSMLLAGPEFAGWRSGRERRDVPADASDVVVIERVDDVLQVTLHRPQRHNAYNRVLRDALCDGLDIAVLDDSITAVEVSGDGPSFCSGGDLDEFGTAPDVVTAHLIRTQRSAGRRLHQLRDRATVTVHGSCIGAGVELPAFAGRVVARPDATFALPELAMGLIPGAGGTVSLPRRIGRWRTTWLAMTGDRIDATTAHAWGLVDEIE